MATGSEAINSTLHLASSWLPRTPTFIYRAKMRKSENATSSSLNEIGAGSPEPVSWEDSHPERSIPIPTIAAGRQRCSGCCRSNEKTCTRSRRPSLDRMTAHPWIWNLPTLSTKLHHQPSVHSPKRETICKCVACETHTRFPFFFSSDLRPPDRRTSLLMQATDDDL